MIATLEAYRAGLYRRGHLLPNLIAGLVVGIVALPLAMAFAIASGAKPEQGIYTAIIAGLAVSLFGGSRVQIAGPTGAFIVILAGVTAKYGIDGLQLATLMAGMILFVLGRAKLGGLIKYIPDPVVVGFTAGIAVIIFVGEWKDFLGLEVAAGGTQHFHEKLIALVNALPTLDIATMLFGLGSLALVLATPRVVHRVPGPLVALIVATAAQAIFRFESVATIGSVFGGIPQELPALQFPEVSFARFLELLGPAITIAMLGAIESLLSAVVADGMAGTRHDSNQELMGQGIANMLTPLFGGFAATGAIARTATNVRNGATGPLAGVVHALTLLLVILVAAPLARDIPLAALAAILFVVAFNMSEAHHFVELVRKAPRNDVLVLLATFFLTVFSDLVIAVNVGVLMAAVLFMRRMAQSVQVELVTPEKVAEEMDRPPLPRSVAVYSIDGPFFFGAAESFERVMGQLHDDVRVVVLRMGRVPFIDVTGMLTLREIIRQFQRHGTRVMLCETNALVTEKLRRTGVLAELGSEDVESTLTAVLARTTAASEPSRLP